MILGTWLRRLCAGDPFSKLRARDWNRVANVLESIEGENGIVIHKTASGRHWRISGEEMDGGAAADSEADSPTTKSVEHNDSGALRLYDFENPNAHTPTAYDKVLLRNTSNGGRPTLRYTPITDIIGDAELVFNNYAGNEIGRFSANQSRPNVTITFPKVFDNDYNSLDNKPSGSTGSFTFISDIQYSDTFIQVKRVTVTVTDGLVTNIGQETEWYDRIPTSEEDY